MLASLAPSRFRRSTHPEPPSSHKCTAGFLEKQRQRIARELSAAAAVGDVGALRLIIYGRNGKRHLDLNKNQDENGNTVLHVAAERGHVEVVELLIIEGAGPDMANRLGWTPLHLSAQNQHVDCATVLLEAGIPGDTVNREGGFMESALHISVYNSDRDTARTLLQHGADQDQPNSVRAPALPRRLLHACDLLCSHLTCSAFCCLCEQFGKTPRMACAERQDEQMMKVLDDAARDAAAAR